MVWLKSPQAPAAILASLFVAVACACALWDIFMMYASTPRATVSDIIGEWGQRWPILPFVVGLIVGHLFWTRIVR